MSLAYAARGLVGVLTPQANTTVEAEFQLLLPPGHAMVNGRLVSGRDSMDDRLRDYFDHYDQAASQFANAPLDVLAYACTGASYLAGREREARTLEAIGRSRGVPVITAATAVVDALRELGATRIALGSPYPAQLTRQSCEYWESHGLKVVRVVSADAPADSFHPIYAMAREQAVNAAQALAGCEADAIVLLGTGMPTLGAIVDATERRSSPPVLSCMLCLAWRSVHSIDPASAPLRRWIDTTAWRAAWDLRQPAGGGAGG